MDSIVAKQLTNPPPIDVALWWAARELKVDKRHKGALRVLVTGNRRWVDLGPPRSILHSLTYMHGPLIVIHGAGRGLDTLVNEYGQGVKDWTMSVHPADWERDKRYAGPKRNKQMVIKAEPDICIGFPAQDSVGTKDCMTKAFLAGIPTYVCEWRTSTITGKVVFRLRPFGRGDHWWHPQYGQDLLDLQKHRGMRAGATESEPGT